MDASQIKFLIEKKAKEMQDPKFKKSPKHEEEIQALSLAVIAIIDSDTFDGPILRAKIAWKIKRDMNETEKIFQIIIKKHS